MASSKARSFNRPANQRRALLRSLARSLIIHERVSTTEAKAKELRPYIERLVSYGKQNTLASRRLAVGKLGKPRPEKKHSTATSPREKEITGGFSRIGS